jgi:ketosteroid isomerase-like protein
MNDQAREIINLTQSLLESIFRGDWQEYRNLCAEDITAIEPEGKGHLIEGLGFHRTYFPARARNPEQDNIPKITISSPHVRIMGDAAVIAYVRLVQVRDDSGAVITTATEETRVWQRSSQVWKHVHFHRSPIIA